MTLPVTRLEWAPSIAATAEPAAGDWVEIDCWERISTVRRLDRRTYRQEPTEITATIDNSDRRYDPMNPSSPYPQLTRRHIRHVVTIGGVTEVLARGMTRSWEPSWQGPTKARVTMAASGLEQRLARPALARNLLEYMIRAYGPRWFVPLTEASGTEAQSMGSDATSWAHSGVDVGAGALVPFGVGASVKYGETGASWTQYGGVDTLRAPFTVLFWMQLEPGGAAAQNMIPYAQGQGGAVNFPEGDLGIRVNTSGAMLVGVTNGTTNHFVKGVNVDLGRPLFIAARYGNTGGTTRLRLTIEATQYSASFGVAPLFPRTGLARIGNAVAAASAYPFRGRIGYFARYDYEMTDVDLAVIRAVGVAPGIGDTTSARVGQIADVGGIPAAMRDIGAGLSTMGPWKFEGNLNDMLARCANTEGGLVLTDRRGRLAFRPRGYVGADRGTFSDRPADGQASPNPPWPVGHIESMGIVVDDEGANTVAVGEISTVEPTEVTWRHPRADTDGETVWDEPTAYPDRPSAIAGLQRVLGDAVARPYIGDLVTRWGAGGPGDDDLLLADLGERLTAVAHHPTAPDSPDVARWDVGLWDGGSWGQASSTVQPSRILGVTHDVERGSGYVVTFDVEAV